MLANTAVSAITVHRLTWKQVHSPRFLPRLATKRMDELTPRMQRFHKRPLQYDYTYKTPGIKFSKAGTLLRDPQQSPAKDSDRDLGNTVEEFKPLTLEHMLALCHMPE